VLVLPLLVPLLVRVLVPVLVLVPLPVLLLLLPLIHLKRVWYPSEVRTVRCEVVGWCGVRGQRKSLLFLHVTVTVSKYLSMYETTHNSSSHPNFEL
jgi:hypothetical protein